MVLAAHRDDHPHFVVVRPWFDDLIMTHEPFGVPNVVWLSFVRIATHRRVFKIPTPPDEAFAFLHSVRGQAGYVALLAARSAADFEAFYAGGARPEASPGEVVVVSVDGKGMALGTASAQERFENPRELLGDRWEGDLPPAGRARAPAFSASTWMRCGRAGRPGPGALKTLASAMLA